jgi:hypothetical protein
MAKGKSSVGFWVLIGTLLVGGGIGAYFLLRKPKEEKESEEEVATDDSPSSSSSSSSQYVAPTPQSFTFPFKTESEGNTFRAWVIDKDPTFASSIKLDATGKLNSYVQKAWDKYGTVYSKKSPSNQSSNKDLEKNIGTIRKNASGIKSEEKYLRSTSADFVDKWAKGLVNNRSTFLWSNQIYNAKTGDRILEYNPYDKTIYSLPKNTRGYKFRTVKYNDGVNAQPNAELGKVKDVAFVNGEVIFYVPSSGTYVWFKEKYVTRNKPKSSFDGGNNQLEFSSFDNNLDLNL